MKRVCFLTNNFNQMGGIERVISSLSYGFSSDDEVSLTVLSLYSKPGDSSFFSLSDSTECIHANCKLGQKADEYLISFFRENRFDDIITFHTGIALMISRIIRKIRPIRWIATEHSHPMSYTWKRRLLNLYAYSKADALVVLTDDAADYYRRRSIKKTVVIPNPVSFISSEYSNYSHTVIAVGRVEEVKRFDLLVNAFGSIENRFPDWKLIIAGSGTQFKKLRQEAQKYKNVELAGRRKDIKEMMLNSSIFAISSQYEGFSVVALEAMECGLPIVSVELPSIHFITKGYNAAVFADQNNEASLAEKLELLMSDPVLVRKMGTEAKSCAGQYHLNVITEYWYKVL